jgi:hypothetical protein
MKQNWNLFSLGVWAQYSYTYTRTLEETEAKILALLLLQQGKHKYYDIKSEDENFESHLPIKPYKKKQNNLVK